MKLLKLMVGILLTCQGQYCLYGQKSVHPAGGEGQGPGGTFSYSIGQVAYSTFGANGESLIEGVQQPFEISMIVHLDPMQNAWEVAAYPNPTTEAIALEIQGATPLELENFKYQLLDIQGRVIEDDFITKFKTSISLQQLPASIYFLTFFDKKSYSKTFKIIKQ